MRTLGATLTAAQLAMGDAKCKIVLTQQGDSTTVTYGVDTTNRILDLRRKVGEWSDTALISVDNRDGNLTALTLEGYTGPVSYGYGANYSAIAPLTVMGQKGDQLQGERVMTFSLAGLFNLWGEQEATVAYSPDEINTDTIKTIMDAIAGATLDCFSDYPSHTITYDTGYDDDIINTFTPKDHFSIAKGESRLSAFQKAIGWTKCKSRVQNDAGTATIHVFQPTITGESYDYEYNDAVTGHNFYDKSVRTRLVLPNKVVVRNHPDHDDSYTGNATDAASHAALGDQYYTKTFYARTSGNAECGRIAAAKLLKYQLAAEKGHGHAPMNCGQEYCDYVKITDSWAGDTRVGNVGYFEEHYTPGKFEMEFRFGTLEMFGLAGTAPPKNISIASPTTQASLVETVNDLIEQVRWLSENMVTAGELIPVITAVNALWDYAFNPKWEEEIAKLSVTLRFQGPQGEDMYT